MRSSSAAILILLSAFGCDRRLAGDRASGSDLAGRCAAALSAAPAQRPSPYTGTDFVPDLFLGDESVVALGAVSGVRWHAASGRHYVLDGIAHRVVVFDSTGGMAFSFGRRGAGPGEFAALNTTTAHSGNAVAFLDSARVAVHDREGVIHVFTLAGEFLHRFPVGDHVLDRHGWRHLDPWTGGSVMLDVTWRWRTATGEPGMLARDPAVRGQLPLHRLEPAEVPRVGEELARLQNPMALVRDGAIQGPFDMQYGRMWGSNESGLVATLSLSNYGVCFFDSALSAVTPYPLGVEVGAIGAKERADYSRWRDARFGPPPMGGIRTWEEFFPFFPDAFPRHTDVVLAPDGTAWLERFVDMERRAWDLFHVERGYLGTIEPFSDRLPVAFTDRCAMVVEEVAPDRVNDASELFGIRLWCPAEAGSG